MPGESDFGGRRRLASSGPEFGAGEGSVEEDDKEPHQRGGGAVGVRIFL